jgi:hypothetical protein
MNTVFTFKATKATENGDNQYQVDLGQDILAGMSEGEVIRCATAHAKVELQNRKGALLRASEDAVAAEKLLQDTFGYPDAAVEVYVPTTIPRKEITLADIHKAIASGKISREDIENSLNA